MANITRAYVPRYPPRYGTASQESPFAEGMQIGGAVGKQLETLGQAIQAGRQQSQMDTAANALLNQDNTSLAQDPDLLPEEKQIFEQPATGGVAALNTAIEMRKAKEALYGKPPSPLDQLRQQRAAALLKAASAGNAPPAGSGNWQRYLANQAGGANQPATTGGGRTRTTQAGGGQQPPLQIGSTPATSMDQVSGYVDTTYGKGTFGQVMQNLHSVDLTSKPGFATFNVGTDKAPKTITIPKDDYTTIGKQINQLRIRNGQAPLELNAGTTPDPQNPPGTITNPIVTKNTLDVSAVPTGQYYVDPQGQTRQRQGQTQ